MEHVGMSKLVSCLKAKVPLERQAIDKPFGAMMQIRPISETIMSVEEG